MLVNYKASPGEKLSRNATDEGSREAAWNKRYRNAKHKDLIRRLRRHLPQGEGSNLALRHAPSQSAYADSSPQGRAFGLEFA